MHKVAKGFGATPPGGGSTSIGSAPTGVDPAVLWNTLKATGASDREAQCLLWETQNDLCRAMAIEKGEALLRKESRATHYNGGTVAIRWLLGRNTEFCHALFEWTKNLNMNGPLLLNRCTTLRFLPEGLIAHGAVNLDGCVLLRELPDAFKMACEWKYGYLGLARCESLERLPDDLHMKGNLVLSGCTSLKRLPSGLVVDGELHMEGCTAWDGMIPGDAVIAGKVFSDLFKKGTLVENHRKYMSMARMRSSGSAG